MTSAAQLLAAARFATGLYRQRLDVRQAAWRGDLLCRRRTPAGIRDPYPIYEQMRARGPILPTRLGNWSTTSHRLCNQVLRSRSFGVAPLGPTADAEQQGTNLSFLEMNEPDHGRLRRLAQPAFSPGMMQRYRTLVEKTTHELLDAAEARGTFDLVTDLAAPLPITVITSMLGIPDADTAAFQRYGAAIGSALSGIRSLRHAREVITADREIEKLFTALFALREQEPRDDLVSVLVAQRGARIRPEELEPMCSLLLIAGFETTVNLIGNGVRALLDHPPQWRALCEEPTLAGPCVEEVLRWDPPVQETGRIAFEETEVGGTRVRKDQLVLALLGAANRDPEAFDAPEVFDITRRPAVEHLAFSAGIHYCLGAPLARLEAARAFTVLAARMPELRLAGKVRMRPSSTIRGPLHLPVAVR
ncbi:MAG TPA: cytochrome P450 [Marmoricola sp.]|nr:cytochrome P450 [Marmoricola sp.]